MGPKAVLRIAVLAMAAVAAVARGDNIPIDGGDDPFALLRVPAEGELPPAFRGPTNKSLVPAAPAVKPLEERGRTFRPPATLLALAQPAEPARVDEAALRGQALAIFAPALPPGGEAPEAGGAPAAPPSEGAAPAAVPPLSTDEIPRLSASSRAGPAPGWNPSLMAGLAVLGAGGLFLGLAFRKARRR
jgi:hypothetical protein